MTPPSLCSTLRAPRRSRSPAPSGPPKHSSASTKRCCRPPARRWSRRKRRCTRRASISSTPRSTRRSTAWDVGQTVAASLAAPTLFTIARDLTKMQVEVSVDEADIGRVRVDGPAKFTVDAFPGETFNGRVVQVRKAAQIVQSVVTYTVIVAVDNPDGHLLPGMTANVKLIVAEKPSVLKVANAALRFRPPGGETRPKEGKSKDDKSRERKSKSERSTGDDGRSGVGGRVWIRGPDGEPQPVALRLGLTDGSATEVLGGDLNVGQEVIVGHGGSGSGKKARKGGSAPSIGR